jgi:hypothetical protein
MTHPRELWFLNTLAGIEVTGTRTGGALDVVSQLLPAGYAPPPHVHRASDEWLAVLAGAVELRCGGSCIPPERAASCTCRAGPCISWRSPSRGRRACS